MGAGYKIKRCMHGLLVGQCYACKMGPVGFPEEGFPDGPISLENDKQHRLRLLKKIGSRINRETRERRETCRGTVPMPERTEKTMSETEKTKICKGCQKPKILDEFPKNPGCKDGHEGKCKRCKADGHKEWSKKKKAQGIGKTKDSTANPPSPEGYGGTGDTKDYTDKDIVVEGLDTPLKPYDESGIYLNNFSELLLKNLQLLQDIKKQAEADTRPVEYQMVFLLKEGLRIRDLKLQIREAVSPSFAEVIKGNVFGEQNA